MRIRNLFKKQKVESYLTCKFRKAKAINFIEPKKPKVVKAKCPKVRVPKIANSFESCCRKFETYYFKHMYYKNFCILSFIFFFF